MRIRLCTLTQACALRPSFKSFITPINISDGILRLESIICAVKAWSRHLLCHGTALEARRIEKQIADAYWWTAGGKGSRSGLVFTGVPPRVVCRRNGRMTIMALEKDSNVHASRKSNLSLADRLTNFFIYNISVNSQALLSGKWSSHANRSNVPLKTSSQASANLHLRYDDRLRLHGWKANAHLQWTSHPFYWVRVLPRVL